jgi:hypothetical protein
LYIYAMMCLNKSLMKILCAVMVLILAIPGYAQQSILSASNDASGNGGMVSYSVGQVAYIINTGIDGTITEGVQQPFEIQNMEGIEQEEGMILECILYPNPAKGDIKLKTNQSEKRKLDYRLLDMKGAILKSDKIVSSETTISMDNLVPSTYFLNVMGQDRIVKTFKVIKK